jgi:hypothetical protein
LCAVAAPVFAQDADAIMKAAKDKMGGFGNGESMGSQDPIIVTDKIGKNKEPMASTQYSKEDKNGNARTVIIFTAPSAQKNTRFLTMDNGKGGSDQWIYLPALNKVRRIASSESGGSFMGTDFSYDDMSLTSRETDDDAKKFINEENYGGASCYVIDSTPTDKDYQYQRLRYFVGKDDDLVYKIELYKKSADTAATKILELSKYENVDNHWTPKSMKISTVADKTYTTITMTRIQYGMSEKQLPDSVFTTNFLQTGRP